MNVINMTAFFEIYNKKTVPNNMRRLDVYMNIFYNKE